MRKLQRFLAVPMGLSALAALWLLYRQAGNHGLVVGLLALLVIATLLFAYGRLQRRTDKSGWAVAGLFVAAIVIAIIQLPSHAARPSAAAAAW